MAAFPNALPAEPIRAPGAEWVIAATALVFGLGFAFLMPPCQTPDEDAHFFRAYHVSEGNWMPTMVGASGGGELPRSILQIPVPFADLPLRPENQTSLACISSLWSLPLSPDDREAAAFPKSAYYSFVPYVPQALGIAVARALGAGVLAIFYAGRLANLGLSVCLIFWTIRLTPIAKLIFGIVTLIPMTVHQFASHSPDASSIGVAFFLSALFLRLALVPGLRAGWPTLALLFGISAWLTLCKFPYAVVTLLFLAVPAERLGGWRRYLSLGFGLMFLVGSLAFIQTQFRHFIADGLPLANSTASIAGQLDFIRHEPLAYLQIIAQTTVEHGRIWMDQLGMLGWLDTFVNPMAMHLLFIFVLIVALADHAVSGMVPPVQLRIVALVSAILCGIVVVTAVYVCGIPVRAKLMTGIQGRYFLPIAPLLLLSLGNRMIAVRAPAHVLLALVVSIGSGVLAIALVNALRRYYFPQPAKVWMSPLAVSLGVVLGAAIAYGVVRWFRPEGSLSHRGHREHREKQHIFHSPFSVLRSSF